MVIFVEFIGSVCSMDDDDAVFVLFKVEEDVNVSSPSSQEIKGINIDEKNETGRSFTTNGQTTSLEIC